jgi:hypothetical protein
MGAASCRGALGDDAPRAHCAFDTGLTPVALHLASSRWGAPGVRGEKWSGEAVGGGGEAVQGSEDAVGGSGEAVDGSGEAVDGSGEAIDGSEEAVQGGGWGQRAARVACALLPARNSCSGRPAWLRAQMRHLTFAARI